MNDVISTNMRTRAGSWKCVVFGAIAAIAALPVQADAEQFVLSQCPTTGKHVALRFNNDHYVLHFHVRIKEMAGTPCFARVRTQVGDDQDAHVVSQNAVLITPETNSDLWSVKMRVPRFASAAKQNSAIYQLELGQQDPSVVDEFIVRESFAWRVTRDAAGMGEMVAGPGIGLPLVIRVARVEGSKVIIESRMLYKGALVDLAYGFSNNIEIGNNNQDTSVTRIAP